MPRSEMVNVGYLVDDVAAAIDFDTGHFGFTVSSSALPAFTDVTRGKLRPLAGPESSAGRPMPGGSQILAQDRAGSLVELFEPASRSARVMTEPDYWRCHPGEVALDRPPTDWS